MDVVSLARRDAGCVRVCRGGADVLKEGSTEEGGVGV